jgi:hypothetical protein
MSLKQRLYRKLLPLAIWFTTGLRLPELPPVASPSWWRSGMVEPDPYD